MTVIWFSLAVLFFILWLNKKPGNNDTPGAYREGYWDGYRAFGDKVQHELDKKEISRDRLEEYIASGYPDEQIVDEATEEPVVTSNQPVAVELQREAKLTPAQHEAKTMRNLNTILYVASFLLVAAAAVFVAASMPANVRLLGIWTVVILFYGAGLVLYRSIPRLRPAAIAFVGTGLAILPFAGFAFYFIGGASQETTWLVTSLIGLVAYGVAAVMMRSQLVSYLTMAFVLSLGLSSIAVVSAPIVWYFILLIGVSLLASVISFLKPTGVPEIFRRPIESTGQVVTPIALLASLIVPDHMSLLTYELVFAVSAAHYFVVWLQARSRLYETIVRIIVHITLLLIGLDIVDQQAPAFATVWLGVAALQAGYSLLRLRPQETKSRIDESIWLGILQGVVLLGSVLWVASDHAAAGTLASFIAIGIISILATMRLRRIAWAYPALMTTLVAPFIVGRWLAQPAWEWQWIAWIFVVAALSVVLISHVLRHGSMPHTKLFLQIAFWLYITTSVLTVVAQMSSIATGWVALAGALLAATFSFIMRQALSEVIGGMLFVLAVASLLSGSALDGMWYTVVTVLISTAGLYVASAAHHFMRQFDRRDGMLMLGQVVLAGLMLTGGGEPVVVTISLVILLLAATLSFGLRIFVQQEELRQILVVSYAVYPVMAWFLSFGLESGWALLVYMVATLLFWASSFVERVPGLIVAGNMALLATTLTLWHWLEFDPDWLVLGTAWITAAVLYGAYGIFHSGQDLRRRQICLVSVWVVLGGAALIQFEAGDSLQKVAAAATLIAGAATLGVEGYLRRHRTMIEASLYLGTFAAQRIVSLTLPEIDNVVLYAHWWAITIGLVAWWRKDERLFTRRLMIAIGFITVGVGLKALSEGGWYQLLFLLEHLGLLVVGALKQANWALWWGVAASVAAVLYFLKDYPYAGLAFLGLILIAVVIWRLIRSGGREGSPRI